MLKMLLIVKTKELQAVLMEGKEKNSIKIKYKEKQCNVRKYDNQPYNWKNKEVNSFCLLATAINRRNKQC